MKKRNLLSVLPAILLASCGRSGGDYGSRPADPKILHSAIWTGTRHCECVKFFGDMKFTGINMVHAGFHANKLYPFT